MTKFSAEWCIKYGNSNILGVIMAVEAYSVNCGVTGMIVVAKVNQIRNNCVVWGYGNGIRCEGVIMI